MQTHLKNISSRSFVYFIIIILISFGISSCSPTRLLEKDQYLLSRYQVKSSNKKNIKKDEINGYIKQKPNKRVFLFFRFHLAVYNTFSRSEKRIPQWITENMGEEPVIYDEYYTDKTVENIQLYLNSKGYYNSEVSYKTKIRRQQVFIKYNVAVEKPYRFRSIRYNIVDTTLQAIVFDNKKQTLIKTAQLFDLDVLKEERIRLANIIKNEGYFNFNKDYIYFQADTSIQMNAADITIGINDYLVRNKSGKIEKTIPHKKYVVDSTFIAYNFDPQKALKQKKRYWNNFDTIQISDRIFILFDDTLNINPRVILRSYFVKNNEFYSLDDEVKTKQQLSQNKLFKLVTINYKDQQLPDSLQYGKINCHINITPFTLQSFTVELEGTNTEGDWGVEVNFKYKHKNVFKGAEVFTMKLKSSFETNKVIDYSQEYGVDMQLEIPKFLFPLKTFDLDKKYRPKTVITIGYNYERNIDYTKPALYFNYGYFWIPKPTTYHKVNVFDINGIRYYKPSEKFEEFREKDYFKYSYEDYYIYALNYTYSYSNQSKRKERDFQIMKYYIETSGNLLYGFSELTHSVKTEGYYETFGEPYSQYIKSDIDLRYYNIKSKNNSTVYHLFIGAAYPYGNSNGLPSIKKYFSGGANSMRAWSSKSLGPGSYNAPDSLKYKYYLGDIKLEANIEKRFHLFWFIDGAVFLDIGNIWTTKDVDLDGSQFVFNKFYKDLAIGIGSGLRFDFKFLIFRVDLGLKIKDPGYRNSKGSHWIIGNRELTASDYNLNIGIGYPF